MYILHKIRAAIRAWKTPHRTKTGILTAREVHCTCEACPTQYEIVLTDGRMAYARYRWGKLSITLSLFPTKDISDAVYGELIYYADTGDEWNGIMSEPHFSNHLGLAGISLAPDLLDSIQ
jgi:hypothetical protein